MAKKSKRRKDVIRRVGGLEAYTSRRAAMRPVIRRVGGLEDPQRMYRDRLYVIRRVGGLEVTVGAFLRLPLT